MTLTPPWYLSPYCNSAQAYQNNKKKVGSLHVWNGMCVLFPNQNGRVQKKQKGPLLQEKGCDLGDTDQGGRVFYASHPYLSQAVRNRYLQYLCNSIPSSFPYCNKYSSQGMEQDYILVTTKYCSVSMAKEKKCRLPCKKSNSLREKMVASRPQLCSYCTLKPSSGKALISREERL